MNIHPLLSSRQISQCQNQCAGIESKFQGTGCDIACVCTQSTIDALGACVNCATAAGQPIPGVGAGYFQNLVNNCNAAGFPVTGPSSGGSGSGGGLGSGGGFTTGLGDTGTATGAGTATNSLGGSFTTVTSGSTTTSVPNSSGNSGGNSGGLTIGKKNSATGLTVQLVAVAAAFGGAVILAA